MPFPATMPLTTAQVSVADTLDNREFHRQILRALPQHICKQVPAASNPYQLATLNTIALPIDFKAAAIISAYSHAGSAGTGQQTVNAYGATPLTGTCSVAPNGDIVFLGTDAPTDVDVIYQPLGAQWAELILPVVAGTGVCALPAAYTALGVVRLLEAEALTGTTPGKKNILVPAASAPATTKANLSVDGATVYFATADAVTTCRVRVAFGYPQT